jgi:hypothetical protein
MQRLSTTVPLHSTIAVRTEHSPSVDTFGLMRALNWFLTSVLTCRLLFADVLFKSDAPAGAEAKRSQPVPRRGALNTYEFLKLLEQRTVSLDASEQVEHVLLKWTCPQVPTQ